jgi:hypothetical protein
VSQLLPMTNAIKLRVSVGLLLTVVDVIVALGLLLGGWNATNSHTLVGYASLLLAPGLLYLSSGVWTKQRWKLVSRLVLYGGAFFALAASTAVLLGVRAFPSSNGIAIYLLIGSLLLTFLLSVFHLILVKREGSMIPSRVPQPLA